MLLMCHPTHIHSRPLSNLSRNVLTKPRCPELSFSIVECNNIILLCYCIQQALVHTHTHIHIYIHTHIHTYIYLYTRAQCIFNLVSIVSLKKKSHDVYMQKRRDVISEIAKKKNWVILFNNSRTMISSPFFKVQIQTCITNHPLPRL